MAAVVEQATLVVIVVIPPAFLFPELQTLAAVVAEKELVLPVPQLVMAVLV